MTAAGAAARRIHVDEIEFFLDYYPTWTSNQLAERFGVNRDSIHNRLTRDNRPDLIAKLRRNNRAAGMPDTSPKKAAAA